MMYIQNTHAGYGNWINIVFDNVLHGGSSGIRTHAPEVRTSDLSTWLSR